MPNMARRSAFFGVGEDRIFAFLERTRADVANGRACVVLCWQGQVTLVMEAYEELTDQEVARALRGVVHGVSLSLSRRVPAATRALLMIISPTVRNSLRANRARKKSSPFFAMHCTETPLRLMLVSSLASLLMREPC